MINSPITNWLSSFLCRGKNIPLLNREQQKHAIPLLHFHLLAPRAYRRLHESGLLSTIEETHAESLKRAYLSSLTQHAKASVVMPKLRQEFADAKIPMIFLKGANLAARYYAHPEDRMFSDFDIFVHPDHRKKTKELLFDLGYEYGDARPKFEANENKIDFRHKEDRALLIDCHSWLGHGRYEIKGCWDRAQKGEQGLELSLADEYLFLLYHAVVQHRVEKLAWMADLLEIRSLPNFPREEIEERAEASHLLPALLLADYWLDRLLNQGAADSELDLWWERITTRSLNGNIRQVMALRSRIYGGWPHLLDYTLKHQSSYFLFCATSAWKSLRAGPQ